MLGLIVKDILLSKHSAKTFAFATLFYFIFGILNDSPLLLCSMVMLLFTFLTFTFFSFDEHAKWEQYALALPISRKKIVLSKYIVCLGTTIIGFMLSSVMIFIFNFMKGKPSILNDFSILIIVLEISLLFSSIVIPIFFKFGIEKGRIIIIGIYMIPYIVLMALRNTASMPSKEVLKMLFYVSPILLLAVLLISYMVSYSIYRKKDI